MSEPTVEYSRMERLGLRFFKRLSQRYPHNFSPDDIHVLNPEERKALRRLQRNAVIRAAIAGGLSAGIGVIIGLLLEPMLQGQVEDPPMNLWLPYFGLVTGISILVTFAEIAFLYWDALRTVHRISAVAGLDLFPARDDDSAVAMALVRAALELPNPPDDLEGVNPRREISKFRLLVGTLIYKLKATATNFLLKAIIRRIVGRSTFRALIEFVAVPVYAAWNAVICWWVLRQARIRAMGPSAATEFVEAIITEAGPHLDETTQRVMLRAVGAAIVRTVDLHPNLVSLMEIMAHRLGIPENVALDDSGAFLQDLKDLSPTSQQPALRILVIAAILDGRIGRREQQLLQEAFQTANLKPNLHRVHRLRRAFVQGDEIPIASILDCLPEPALDMQIS